MKNLIDICGGKYAVGNDCKPFYTAFKQILKEITYYVKCEPENKQHYCYEHRNGRILSREQLINFSAAFMFLALSWLYNRS